MRSQTALQFLHDRLVAILRQIPTPIEMPEKDLQMLRVATDVLCWALQHDHNRGFALNMARLRHDLYARGIFATVDEPIGPAEARGLLEAGERFLVVRVPASGAEGIQCMACEKTSWNPGDLQNLYCGNCHVFHADAMKADMEQLETWANAKEERT